MKKSVFIASLMAAVCMSFSSFAGTMNLGAYIPKAASQIMNGPGANVINQVVENVEQILPAAEQEVGQAAAQVENLMQTKSNADASIDLAKVKVPESAKVLITLGAGKDDNNGTLTLFRKDGQNWTGVLSTGAMIGKKGLYKTAEGDCKTPVGVFKMNTPFGRAAALEGFPSNYLKVDSSHYWVGDSASSKYNKLVSTNEFTDFKKSESEHIIDYGAYYNYCIDTGYNPDCVPKKGSAIYLHCVVNGEDTHGCIAIPEAQMIEVMRNYQEGSTYIVIFDKEKPETVY